MKYYAFCIAVLAFSFCLFGTTLAADIHYGKVSDSNLEEIIVTYSGFLPENTTTYRCSLDSSTCTPPGPTETLLPATLFGGKNYFLSPNKDRAIVTSFDAGTGLRRYELVSITNSHGTFSTNQIKTLAVTEAIQRVIWSTDGNRLLLVVPSGFYVRYDIATNEFEYLEQAPAGAGWLTLSPNGQFLAYYVPATLSRGKRTFGVIDTVKNKSYTYNEKVNYRDLLTEGVRIFSFSTDSKKLLYLSDREDNPTLFQVNLASLSSKAAMAGEKIISKPYTVSDFIWQDASTILFTANRENPLQWSLYSYNPTVGTLATIANNTAFDSSMKRIRNNIIFSQIRGNTLNPTIYNVTTKQVLPLSITFPLPTAVSTNTVVKAGSLYGVYQKPLSATKPGTLLVWLHGGPFRQTSSGYHSYKSYAEFDWALDEAAASGVAVLKLDYPGSYGYGRAFAESVTKNVGIKDVKDTAAAVTQFATQNGYKNIYLLGNSYGGYLALKTLVEHPAKFAGAFSVNGVTDWRMLTDKLQNSIFNVQFGGLYDDTTAKYYETADITKKLDRVTTQKIYLTHGDTDTTIPFDQSVNISEGLKLMGKQADLTIFPGEDHVYSKPETLEALCKKILEFVDANRASHCDL